jgi:hypothetical protein
MFTSVFSSRTNDNNTYFTNQWRKSFLLVLSNKISVLSYTGFPALCVRYIIYPIRIEFTSYSVRLKNTLSTSRLKFIVAFLNFMNSHPYCQRWILCSENCSRSHIFHTSVRHYSTKLIGFCCILCCFLFLKMIHAKLLSVEYNYSFLHIN